MRPQAHLIDFLLLLFVMMFFSRVVFGSTPLSGERFTRLSCAYFIRYATDCQALIVRPVGRRSGGTGVPLCGSLVVTQNVCDEIRVNVHVVTYHRWRFPELTQNPTDFGNLGSFIRQALFHLACNFFCVVHFRFFVSHACIISDSWVFVKGNQGFFLLPIYIIGIFHPLSPPFLKF